MYFCEVLILISISSDLKHPVLTILLDWVPDGQAASNAMSSEVAKGEWGGGGGFHDVEAKKAPSQAN